MDVSLPDDLVERIDEWVRDGSYGSRADVIAEAIFLLGDHDAGRERAGHATIQTTVDQYGHLLPGDDTSGELIRETLDGRLRGSS